MSTSSPSPKHKMAKFIAITTGVAVVIVAVLLACGVACCYRRLGCPLMPLVVDGRRAGGKRRVVVMHSNSLYDSDAATKHPHSHHHQQQQLAFLMPPRVKVETSGNRRRLLSTVFEYEIPLDSHWEFPRDKSAAVIVLLYSYYIVYSAQVQPTYTKHKNTQY